MTHRQLRMSCDVMRVLAVDDDESFAEVIKAFLEVEQGTVVRVALSTKEARKKLEEDDYDAIVCDYQMPGEDGIEFLKWLRKEGEEIPFILFTGKGREEVAKEALNVGADGYLQKTIPLEPTFAELRHRINSVVHKRKAEELLRQSEERLREIIEATPAGYFFIDSEGRFRKVNKAWLSMHGYDHEKEVIGKHFSLTQPPDYLPEAERVVARVLSGETISHGEAKRLTRDGRVLYHNYTARPVNLNGSVIGLEGFLIDTTQHMLSERALVEAEQRLRGLFETMIDAVAVHEIILDEGGRPVDSRLLQVNPAFEALTGLSSDHVIGRTLREVIPGLEDFWVERLGKVAMTGEPDRFVSYAKPMGKYFSVSAYRNAPMQFTVIFEDVTDRIIAEERLRESEAKYRTLFESASEAIVLAQGSMLLMVNPMAIELTGYSREEMLCLPLTTFIHPDDRGMVTDIMTARAKGENAPSSYQIRVLKKSGEVRWTDVKAVRVNWNGRPASLAYLTDITEMKLAEENLRTSHEVLEDVLDFFPEATFVVDSEGEVVAWNRAMEKLTGVPKEEMLGKKGGAQAVPFYGISRPMLHDLIAMDDKELESKYDYVTRKGEVLYAETFCPALADGKGLYIWGTAAPIYDAKGRRIGAIETVRDVTDLRRKEMELSKMNSSLRMLNEIVRHDLNNQMVVLSGLLGLCLRLTTEGDKLRPSLERMAQVLENVQEQVWFMSDYQRVGASEPAWFSFATLVEDAFSRLRPKGVTLHNMPKEFQIFADPLVKRVPYNLIDNSMRHGGGVKNIRVSAEVKGKELVIVYEDDGVGIKEEDKPRLFEKGFGKNTGLGLFLIREILIVTNIKIYENGEKGAKFLICVPENNWKK
ncbi:MAG: PAS domain S-box protein [Methanomassiliicoccales archaeon]